MNTFYGYLVLLLLMFVLIYYGASYSFKYAPVKIKILSCSSIIIISLRYIALVLLLFIRNIKNLYLLKSIVYLNLLCIPILAVIAIYIFARNDKFKFNYCLIADILFVIIYILTLIKFPISVENYKNLGYIMYYDSIKVQYGIYVIYNTILFFQGVILLGNRNTNKYGMGLILLSAFIVVVESLIGALGVSIFPSIIFGDIIWMGTIDYALYKLKK